MENMLKMSKIYQEIYEYKEWDKDIADHMPTLRKKYRQLLKTIVIRDISNYKQQNAAIENYVPESDALIVKELLIKATSGKGKSVACSQWFNGTLKNDYVKIAELYTSLITYMQRLEMDGDIDEITFQRWKAAIDTSLGGETSLRILEMNKSIDEWFENSRVLNNYINDIGPLIYYDEDGNRSVLFDELPEEVDITATPIAVLLRYIRCQEDYVRLMTAIWNLLSIDAFDRSAKLVCSIAEIIRNDRINKLNINIRNENLAFEGSSFYYQIYRFLKDNPETCKEIESMLKMRQLTELFKVVEDDDDKYKNDCKES